MTKNHSLWDITGWPVQPGYRAVLVQGRPSRKERAAAGSRGSWLTASGPVFMPGPALSCSYREPSDRPPDKHHQDCSTSVLIIQL